MEALIRGPHTEASDLGLHCLPMSNKKDARLIWVNIQSVLSTIHLRSALGLQTIHEKLMKKMIFLFLEK